MRMNTDMCFPRGLREQHLAQPPRSRHTLLECTSRPGCRVGAAGGTIACASRVLLHTVIQVSQGAWGSNQWASPTLSEDRLPSVTPIQNLPGLFTLQSMHFSRKKKKKKALLFPEILVSGELVG